MMMYDMDLKVADMFFYKDGITARDVTVFEIEICFDGQERSGIINLFPNSLIHEHVFQPCGYSMNGLIDKVSLICS